MKRETIKRWLNGDIREWAIGADDVLPYEAGRSVECIITSIATTADVDEWERRRYGMRLMRGFLRFLDDLAMQGVTITRFYAASAAPDGLSLLRKAKFEERGSIGKRVVFELDPVAAESRIAKTYRKALRDYRYSR